MDIVVLELVFIKIVKYPVLYYPMSTNFFHSIHLVEV